jgi:hypothetical protein
LATSRPQGPALKPVVYPIDLCHLITSIVHTINTTNLSRPSPADLPS